MEFPSIDDKTISKELSRNPDFEETKFTEKIFLKKKKKKHELAPHQKFVKLFLDFETHYESLLLYHGLGTGKTCSSVSCSESFIEKQCYVFVVCPASLKSQFKSQLLKNIEKDKDNNNKFQLVASCPLKYLEKQIDDNKSLQENVDKINALIEKYYFIFSYDELATFIESKIFEEDDLKTVRTLKFWFDHSLLIIDECHNICKNVKLKRALENKLFRKSTFKLLLMSATPIYKNVDEIIWIVNFLNSQNHTRPIIHNLENFKKHINGIVSYVKGDNPFTFPMKIFPSFFLTPPQQQQQQQQQQQRNNKISNFLFTHKKGTNKFSTIIQILEESEGKILIFFEEIDQNFLLEAEHLKDRICILSEKNIDKVPGDNGNNIILFDNQYFEGTDFKNIRQLHVVKPCETFTKLQQIIGRACRSYSHKDLKPEDQNVQIFLHALPHEIKIYEKLYKDYLPLSNILEILQTNSVDSELNSEQEKEYKIDEQEIQLSWKKQKIIYNFETQTKYLNKLYL
jgi:superfamily II DNA or RNA helicase